MSISLILLFIGTTNVLAFDDFQIKDSDGNTVIIDYAMYLTDEEKNQLSYQIANISYQYDYDITIMILDHYLREGDLTRMVDHYENVDLTAKGVIFGLNIDPDTREFQFSIRNDNGEVISDKSIKRIESDVVSILKTNDYSLGIFKFVEMVEQAAKSYAVDNVTYSYPFRLSDIPIVIIIVPLLFGIVVVSIIMFGYLVPQMKTANIQTKAISYVNPNDLELTNRSDVFINQTVIRTKIQKSSSGGRRGAGGGSRRGGGGRF